jgi:hypothetical protein
MTTIITPEMIQEISVDIVKDYVANKTPLSDGIAKVASELELNPEQIRRVIESCNTVTYLSLQKQAQDRTFEFPLADYNSVLGGIVMPKEANTAVVEQDFKDATAKPELQKEAAYEPDLQTIQTWTRTEYLRNKSMLEKLAFDAEAVVQNIGDVSTRLRKDEYALEKLAEVATEEDFKRLACLIRPVPEKLEDRIFKEAELKDAQLLVDLYKEAQAIAEEKKKRTDLEKRAMAGALAGALGKSIGGTGALAITGAGTAISNVAKNIYKPKTVHPLDVAATALTEPKASSNVWSNLQSRKRF